MGKPCHLLAVDDSHEIRHLLERALTDAGYTFESATSAEAAISAMSRTKPNVVIADLWLRGLQDGLRVAAYARSMKTPAILVTADHLAESTLRASGFPYLLKPFTLPDLHSLIERVLRDNREDCVV